MQRMCRGHFYPRLSLQVKVIQEYHNHNNDPIEVINFFPVEEKVAVSACSAEDIG